jgi:hypothetical protein
VSHVVLPARHAAVPVPPCCYLVLARAAPLSVVAESHREEMKETQLSLIKAANKEEFKQRQKDRESTLKKEAANEKKTRESERTYYQNTHGATFTPDTSPGMRRSGGSTGSFRSSSVGSRRARKAGADSDSKDGENGAAGDSAPAMRRPPSSPGGAPESPN